MQISVSSVLTVFHDGQFWVGLAEQVGDGRYGAARIVFGAEPGDEEILQFGRSKWAKLAFFDDETGVGPREKPTPRRRDGGTLRATGAEAQAEAPRALVSSAQPFSSWRIVSRRSSSTVSMSKSQADGMVTRSSAYSPEETEGTVARTRSPPVVIVPESGP